MRARERGCVVENARVVTGRAVVVRRKRVEDSIFGVGVGCLDRWMRGWVDRGFETAMRHDGCGGFMCACMCSPCIVVWMIDGVVKMRLR